MTSSPRPVLGTGARARASLRGLALGPDAWSRLRDWLLAHPRLQRWAFRLPGIRWVARRRAAALFDLCAGFVYSQVLFAGVRLGLFERLRAGPRHLAALAEDLGLSLEATGRLVRAGISLRLLEVRAQGRIGLGPQGAALVGNPSIAGLVEHHAMLYADLSDPVALLRDGARDTELRRYWAYAADADPARLPSPRTAAYSSLMADTQALLADLVLDAFPLPERGRMLDVAGGEGAFLSAAARRAPQLTLGLFDLPSVVERARARLEHEGLAGRVRLHGGDLFRDPLPENLDLASLVRVLHDHDDFAALAILRRVHAALAPRGRVLVAEPMSATKGAEASGDAYFGFYLLAMGQGRPRRPEQIAALLVEAGFWRPRTIETRHPMLCRLVVAERGS